MKKIFVTIFVLLMLLNFSFSNVVEARTIRVKGYYKPSTGRYIMPYYRTSSNNSIWDNWSTKGNINPFTGKKGTINPWRSSIYFRF
jgi:hypothetical protein